MFMFMGKSLMGFSLRLSVKSDVRWSEDYCTRFGLKSGDGKVTE